MDTVITHRLRKKLMDGCKEKLDNQLIKDHRKGSHR